MHAVTARCRLQHIDIGGTEWRGQYCCCGYCCQWWHWWWPWCKLRPTTERVAKFCWSSHMRYVLQQQVCDDKDNLLLLLLIMMTMTMMWREGKSLNSQLNLVNPVLCSLCISGEQVIDSSTCLQLQITINTPFSEPTVQQLVRILSHNFDCFISTTCNKLVTHNTK